MTGIAYFCSMNIKEEYGKWFLDVAKYVLTAMLLTSMIEGLSRPWLISATAAIVVLSLAFGTLLLKRGDDEEKRRIRNRNRNKK